MIQRQVHLPWKKTHIVFIGDVQWSGHPEAVAIGHLQQTIADALEYEQQGDAVYFLSMGDMTDFMSPSNRARYTSANLYDTSTETVDDTADRLVNEIVQVALTPTKGKWLGMVEGHHFHEFKHGDTSDMRLAKLLDARLLGPDRESDLHLGTTGLLHLVFEREQNGMQIPVTIWFAHGIGNGQTGYYPLMRLEKKAAEWEGVDVFAMGHTTKMAHEFMNKPFPRWGIGGTDTHDVVHRKVILIGTGGYSKTYVLNAKQGRIPRGGYAEQKMLNATIIGSPVLHIRPRLREGRLGIDLTAEG